VQISGDVVAMADPMSVVTNLRLIGREGEVLTALEAARFLNEIVYALPWQSEVQRALHVGHA
jgi:glucosamine 6-phosphate synthetase-like amidotransferase/phosphosugar isomerase protein